MKKACLLCAVLRGILPLEAIVLEGIEGAVARAHRVLLRLPPVRETRKWRHLGTGPTALIQS